MIYPEEKKPYKTAKQKQRQREFWKYDINPISGYTENRFLRATVVDSAVEVSPMHKPAFRLAI